MHFCALASNASLDHYPQNSLTKFANSFSDPLYPNPIYGDKFHVRLRSIVISKKLRRRDPNSNVVNIYLSEASSNYPSSRFDNCLAKLHVPFISKRKQGEHYFVKHFENSQFIPIRAVPITKLSVLITNGVGEQLNLAYGPPTIIEIEMTTMEVTNQFTVTCSPSSARSEQHELYPNNTLTDFTMKLPDELDLNGWQVALANIVYPPDMERISEEVWLKVTTTEGDGEPDEVLMEFDLTSSKGHTSVFLFDVKRRLERSTKVVMRQLENGNHQFLIPHTVEENVRIRIEFSDAFVRCFGQFEPEGRWVMKKNEAVTLHGVPNIGHVTPSSVAAIYCDIVEPSIMGSQKVPMLHLLSLEQATKNKVLYEPDHLVFRNVVQRRFSTVNIKIKQPDGRDHNFSGGKKDMLVTLLFRPRSKKSRGKVYFGGADQTSCSRLFIGNC